MKKEFVMRGQTASGETEVLNFSGYKPGYAYRLVEFDLYPSTNVGAALIEMTASITAGKVAIAPTDVNFNDEGLIATALFVSNTSGGTIPGDFYKSVINDTFLITQNLILMVQAGAGSSADPINWQCRFVAEKVNTAEGAVANYKQFSISDG